MINLRSLLGAPPVAPTVMSAVAPTDPAPVGQRLMARFSGDYGHGPIMDSVADLMDAVTTARESEELLGAIGWSVRYRIARGHTATVRLADPFPEHSKFCNAGTTSFRRSGACWMCAICAHTMACGTDALALASWDGGCSCGASTPLGQPTVKPVISWLRNHTDLHGDPADSEQLDGMLTLLAFAR